MRFAYIRPHGFHPRHYVRVYVCVAFRGTGERAAATTPRRTPWQSSNSSAQADADRNRAECTHTPSRTPTQRLGVVDTHTPNTF